MFNLLHKKHASRKSKMAYGDEDLDLPQVDCEMRDETRKARDEVPSRATKSRNASDEVSDSTSLRLDEFPVGPPNYLIKRKRALRKSNEDRTEVNSDLTVLQNWKIARPSYAEKGDFTETEEKGTTRKKGLFTLPLSQQCYRKETSCYERRKAFFFQRTK